MYLINAMRFIAIAAVPGIQLSHPASASSQQELWHMAPLSKDIPAPAGKPAPKQTDGSRIPPRQDDIGVAGAGMPGMALRSLTSKVLKILGQSKIYWKTIIFDLTKTYSGILGEVNISQLLFEIVRTEPGNC